MTSSNWFYLNYQRDKHPIRNIYASLGYSVKTLMGPVMVYSDNWEMVRRRGVSLKNSKVKKKKKVPNINNARRLYTVGIFSGKIVSTYLYTNILKSFSFQRRGDETRGVTEEFVTSSRDFSHSVVYTYIPV